MIIYGISAYACCAYVRRSMLTRNNGMPLPGWPHHRLSYETRVCYLPLGDLDNWDDDAIPSYVGYEQVSDGGTHHRTPAYPYFDGYFLELYRWEK